MATTRMPGFENSAGFQPLNCQYARLETHPQPQAKDSHCVGIGVAEASEAADAVRSLLWEGALGATPGGPLMLIKY